jgi:hypothetical protein
VKAGLAYKLALKVLLNVKILRWLDTYFYESGLSCCCLLCFCKTETNHSIFHLTDGKRFGCNLLFLYFRFTDFAWVIRKCQEKILLQSIGNSCCSTISIYAVRNILEVVIRQDAADQSERITNSNISEKR